jgi:hypothetical protein
MALHHPWRRAIGTSRTSWASPGLSASLTGRPLLSTNARILLVKPPRDLPIDWRWFLVMHSILMHADNGGINHLDSGNMSGGKCVHDASQAGTPALQRLVRPAAHRPNVGYEVPSFVRCQISIQ